jgi:microcompartment protein CcmK/EutM
MSLPSEWIAAPAHKANIGGDLFREYHISGDPELKLCFYYRGIRTSQFDGETFKQVLQKPPHDLSDAELSTLAATLRNKNPQLFAKTVARTEDLNGKRVLVVEGSYDQGKPTQIDNRSIYVDSDGTGTAVQEIFCQGPSAKFQKHSQEYRAALSSIRWK